MYHLFAQPQSIAIVAPFMLKLVGCHTILVGHSFFGDLFLRNTSTGEYAILLVSKLELVETGEIESNEFELRILGNSEVIGSLLRPDDAAAIASRVGTLLPGEAYFPVPLPALGGSGELNTFEKGGLLEYLAIVAQSIAPHA